MTAQVTVVLAVVALLLLVLSRWLRAASGVPDGSIAFEDSGLDAPILRSAKHGLIGKPDYLLTAGSGLVPVEVKPSRHEGRAYRSDILQLAAYCILTEETQESFGGYGILRAGNATRRVAFTPELRSELLDTLDEMRNLMEATDVAANHASPTRCRSCACRAECGRPIPADSAGRGLT